MLQELYRVNDNEGTESSTTEATDSDARVASSGDTDDKSVDPTAVSAEVSPPASATAADTGQWIGLSLFVFREVFVRLLQNK